MNIFYGFVILLPLCCQAQDQQVSYEGCMIEEGADTAEEGGGDLTAKRGPFRYEAGKKDRLTVHECVYRCWFERFKYAAMQGGSRCFCSSTTRGLERHSDKFCYSRCLGNCRQRCGGPVMISVYDTAYQVEPQISVSGQILRKGLIGCLKKSSLSAVCTKSHGRMAVPNLKSGRMTAAMCALYCAAPISYEKSEVAVLMFLDTCCCGPSHQRTVQEPRVSNDKCNVPCVGTGKPDVDVACGSSQYMTVYSIRQLKEAGMPQERKSRFTLRTGWLNPPFPTNDKFELKDGVLGLPNTNGDNSGVQDNVVKQMPELMADARRDQPLPSQPVVEADNAGVKVVDVPEEDDFGSSAWIIAVIVIFSLLILAAILFVLHRRRATVVSSLGDEEALLADGKRKSRGSKNTQPMPEPQEEPLTEPSTELQTDTSVNSETEFE